MVVVMLIVFVTNVLLLFAAGRFLGGGENPARILIGAGFAVLFTLLSILPGFSFLDHILWRLAAMTLTALSAFGFRDRALLRMLVFLLLQLSLGGLTGEKSEAVSVLLGAAGIGFACLLLSKQSKFIPVELHYGNQTLHMTALRDTGNTLRDPVTGKSVLVVSAHIAEQLTGLTADALRDPVETMGKVPGLRLIPYQSVGSDGFLLAVFVPQAKIGTKQGSAIVAFSPMIFESNYQALTGGTV